MSKKILILTLLAVLLPFAVSAKAIGPTVSKYRGTELKWEDGAYGYHVMFKSLLKDEDRLTEEEKQGTNPQGDRCKTASTYALDFSHIPSDAIIEDAYLIWTAAQPVAKKDSTTDDEVNLSFVSDDGTISETQTIKGKKAYKISEAGNVDFEFDAIRDVDNPSKNWFTYRVKILDFFKSIQEKGRALVPEGASIYDGNSLIGNYTLSGLECTEDDVYRGSTEMVADWSIVLIYSSVEISPKKIYMYDGFKVYWYEQAEINVTGFEFPLEPEIRITLATHEGDPGLANADPEDHQAIPEGIQVQGEPPVEGEWLLISNKCNPLAYRDDNYVHLEYTEIFNSISSVYGYNDVEPTCIGGEPPILNNEDIEFGMDVDTFVMDSSADGSYAAHFHKGDNKIALRIGANKDSVITNYMIVSVDTKSPQFDIPGYPEKVACTPAGASDENSLEGKWCQNGLEHTFALRIQNWGTDFTGAITVVDAIPAGMEYVPGSTEYATSFKVENKKKIATRWMPVPDNGGFPLENGFKVADSLNFCDSEAQDYLSCQDLIMVRFRAKVKNDTPKNQVIENTAFYKTAGVNDYKTNLGIPVKLKMVSAGCVSSQDAVDLSECGGVGAAACTKNEDCGEGYVCDNASGACIEDPAVVKCQNSEVTASEGKNSINSEVIFIGNPQTDLVIGQLELAGNGEKCYFNLDQVKLKVSINDSNILISDLKMFKDVNSNGTVDAEDVLLASTDSLSSEYAIFSPSKDNKLWSNKKNNILFALSAKYKDDSSISNSAFFKPSIEKDGGITISDGGKPVVSGLPIDFSKFQFEPDKGFIVTKGLHDPEVPAKSEMNKFRDILQIRVKANGADETIKKMTIKVPKNNLVSFGKGITKLAVYEDTDNDGQGDTELAATTSFEGVQKHQFTLNFDVPQNTDKYLTIKAELALNDGETAQIQISSITVNDLTVLGLPVDSRPYEYMCDPNLEDCGGDGGCSIVAAEDNGNAALIAIAAALALILSALAFRMRKN